MSVRRTGTWERLSRLLRKRGVKVSLITLGVIGLAVVVISSYASLFSDGKASPKKHGASSNRRADAAMPPSGSPDASQGVPAGILNLSDWKLTLPTAASDGEGGPEEIEQPQLATFVATPYFAVNSQRDGVQFQAPVNGVTTKGSHYPRSELREMTDNGQHEASWSDTSGTHTMTIREAITHLPVVKPELVAGQIHDEESDVIMIRLEGSKLFVEADGRNVGTLDGNYQLGAVFSVQITAATGRITVSYNGVQKVDYRKEGTGYYFKAGCYTQSNTSKGDDSSAYGQVVIYNLQVSHT